MENLEAECGLALGGRRSLWCTSLHIFQGSGMAPLGLTLDRIQHPSDCPSQSIFVVTEASMTRPMGSMKILVLLAISMAGWLPARLQGRWKGSVVPPGQSQLLPPGNMGLLGDYALVSGEGTEAQLHTVTLINLRSFLLGTSSRLNTDLWF